MKNEIKKFLEETPYNKILRDNYASTIFSEYYQKAFGIVFCSGCPGSFGAAYNELTNFANNKIKINMKTECKFTLKENAVVYDKVSGKNLTNKNLTDELALNMLTSVPGSIIQFEKVPTDLNELITEHTAKLLKDAEAKENATTEEVITGVETKEQFTERIKSYTKQALKNEAKKRNLPGEDLHGKNAEALLTYLVDSFIEVPA